MDMVCSSPFVQVALFLIDGLTCSKMLYFHHRQAPSEIMK